MTRKAAVSRSVVEVEPPPAIAPEALSQGAADIFDTAVPDPSHETELCASMPLTARIEAVLMCSDRPLTEGRLAEVLGLAGKGVTKSIVSAIEELNRSYEASSRAFRAERLAGGWQLLTLPAFGPLLHRLHAERQQSKLSQPALETLAIIAYRQPIMRAEIEAIRGVASGEVLRGLMERRLIKIVGRAEELGRPMLYGTTKEFLKVFGLANPDDLPAIKGLTNPSDAARPSTSKVDSASLVTAESQETAVSESEANVGGQSPHEDANASKDGEDS